MREFLLKKERFEFNKDLPCKLSIRPGLDGFSFMVQPVGSDEIAWFHQIPGQFTSYNLLLRNLKEIIGSNAFPNCMFQKVTILWSDPHFHLIPSALYSEKLVNYLFPFRQKPENHPVSADIPALPDAKLVFSIPGGIADFVNEKFLSAALEHEVINLISNKNKWADALLVHFHSSWFYVLTGNPHLSFFLNTFEFSENTDILYYLCAVMKDLEINGIPVFLSGMIDHEDEKFHFLKKNLPHVEIIQSVPGNPDSSSADIPLQLLPGMLIL